MTSLQRAKRVAASRYLLRGRGLRSSNSAILRPENNVVGVGLGWKIKGGQFTDRKAVRFYVTAKLDSGSVAKEISIPAEIDGVPTDVVETGYLLPAAGVLPDPRAPIP